MKRRTGNAEAGKPPRRQMKRTSKFADSVYGSSFVYIKFFMVWAFIIFADFILEFRFEYLWPFWLLLQSCYETFKCQGLVYSVFFVCIAITSDTICFLFIPLQWLFFVASTYVWIHYVWHTEKGLCLPTALLWFFFMYIEATLRLRDLKTNPFHIELCRPFAAHCIGHPVVTLGIGFKSYISYRMRLRTQRQVQKENNFYYELLRHSLPRLQHTNHTLAITDKDKTGEVVANGNVALHSNQQQKKTSDKSSRTVQVDTTTSPQATSSENGTASKSATASTMQASRKTSTATVSSGAAGSSAGSKSPSGGESSSTTTGENDGKRRSNSYGGRRSNSSDSHNSSVTSSSSGSNRSTNKSNSGGSNSPKSTSTKHNGGGGETATTTEKQPRRTSNKDLSGAAAAPLANGHISTDISSKIELISAQSVIEQLETTVSKLSAELTLARKNEAESRNKLEVLITMEKSARNELTQMKRENELLQTKYQNLFTGKQKDKLNMQSMEKRLRVEAESRSSAEKQLQEEIRRRKEEEKDNRVAAVISSKEKETCEFLRQVNKNLEAEVSCMQSDLKKKEEGYNILRKEVTELQQREKSVKESETLMSALEAMQEKNQMLENSLSAETKLKLDLFSALGDVKRQLEIAHGVIYKRDTEIVDLKSRMTDLLSVMPNSRVRASTPHYSTNFLEKPLVRAPPDYTSGFCSLRTPVPPALAQQMQVQQQQQQQSDQQQQQHQVNHLGHPLHLDPNAIIYTPPNTTGSL